MSTQNLRKQSYLEMEPLQLLLVKMRPHWIGWTLYLVTGILIIREKDTDRQTDRHRKSGDDGDREWSDASTIQETSRTADKGQELWGAWDRFSLRASRMSKPGRPTS